MAILVTISVAGDVARLRRYEGRSGANTCTHAGLYDISGVSLVNVEYYRERGAHQDIRPSPRRAARRSRKRPA